MGDYPLQIPTCICGVGADYFSTIFRFVGRQFSEKFDLKPLPIDHTSILPPSETPSHALLEYEATRALDRARLAYPFFGMHIATALAITDKNDYRKSEVLTYDSSRHVRGRLGGFVGTECLLELLVAIRHPGGQETTFLPYQFAPIQVGASTDPSIRTVQTAVDALKKYGLLNEHDATCLPKKVTSDLYPIVLRYPDTEFVAPWRNPMCIPSPLRDRYAA